MRNLVRIGRVGRPLFDDDTADVTLPDGRVLSLTDTDRIMVRTVKMGTKTCYLVCPMDEDEDDDEVVAYAPGVELGVVTALIVASTAASLAPIVGKGVKKLRERRKARKAAAADGTPIVEIPEGAAGADVPRPAKGWAWTAVRDDELRQDVAGVVELGAVPVEAIAKGAEVAVKAGKVIATAEPIIKVSRQVRELLSARQKRALEKTEANGRQGRRLRLPLLPRGWSWALRKSEAPPVAPPPAPTRQIPQREVSTLPESYLLRQGTRATELGGVGLWDDSPAVKRRVSARLYDTSGVGTHIDTGRPLARRDFRR